MDFGFQIDVAQAESISPVKELTFKSVPIGLNNSSSLASGSYYDAFRRKILPTDQILVKEYKRVAYTCANLNAAGVMRTPLKLYIKTSKGDRKSILRKGMDTKSLSSDEINRLTKTPYLQKTLRSFINIEEVINHPILDLLEKANDSPYLNGQRLTELTQLYQEITGKAYWLVEDNLFGIPENLWIIPSQYIRPIKKRINNAIVVDFYEYIPPGIDIPVHYSVDEIIAYLMPNLINPYVDGLSPLQASFEANEVNNKFISHQDALLENEGRPDAILTPNKDSAISPIEARRLEREYHLRFARGRDGGLWAMQEDSTFTPIAFPPRDLAKLEINKWTKNDISNSYSVPYALIAEGSHNRQQLEAAEHQHAVHAIRPRLDRDVCIKNDRLLSRYDNSGRLFLAYDDPVPENREEKLEENVQLTMTGIRTPNEAREQYGQPPLPGGDKLRPINVSPEMMRDQKANSGTDDREGEK